MVSLAIYILIGFSLMKIAEKLNIENSWLGFIPFARYYLIGKIAEKSDEVCNTEKKHKWSKILLWCEIISGILTCLISISSFFAFIPYIGWLICLIVALPCGLVKIVLSVPTYFAYYKIFKFMAGKDNAVWMLILSIFFDIAVAVLFAVFAFSDQYPKVTDPNAPIEGTAEEIHNEKTEET